MQRRETESIVQANR